MTLSIFMTILSSGILYFVYYLLGHYYTTIVYAVISGIALRPTKEWIVEIINDLIIVKTEEEVRDKYQRLYYIKHSGIIQCFSWIYSVFTNFKNAMIKTKNRFFNFNFRADVIELLLICIAYLIFVKFWQSIG